jgi:hypothetical protein
MLVNQGDHPKLVSGEASRQPPPPRLGLPQLRLAARIYQLLTPLQWQMFGSIFGFFIVRHICNAQGCQPPMTRRCTKFVQFRRQFALNTRDRPSFRSDYQRT